MKVFTDEAGLIGAFDGCGGLGSRACAGAKDMTEAYIASRAIGSAVLSWFRRNGETGYEWNIDGLRHDIINNLKMCEDNCGGGGIKLRGSLVRSFPSTVAIAIFQVVNKELVTRHIWAGDSRTYVITSAGLAQISIDDIQGEDAMSNLTRDGALTNVVSSDNKFVLHSRELRLKEPCIVMSATDGCFGYVSSPMEFEKMILETLMRAGNVEEWKEFLAHEISERAGDDQTIALAAFGFSSFEDMKKFYCERCKAVYGIVNEFGSASPERKQELWLNYKPGYYRYISE